MALKRERESKHWSTHVALPIGLVVGMTKVLAVKNRHDQETISSEQPS